MEDVQVKQVINGNGGNDSDEKEFRGGSQFYGGSQSCHLDARSSKLENNILGVPLRSDADYSADVERKFWTCFLQRREVADNMNSL